MWWEAWLDPVNLTALITALTGLILAFQGGRYIERRSTRPPPLRSQTVTSIEPPAFPDVVTSKERPSAKDR